MMTIRASVILISHNSKADLATCLPSLLPTVSREDEILIVDNASLDGVGDWIRNNFPCIRFIRNDLNIGFGGGCNIGAHNANGKYLVFLNPDTIVEAGWVDALVASLESDTTIGLATPMILLLHDPDRINTCGNEMHISGITLCRGMDKTRASYQKQTDVGAISGTAFVIRKNLFERLEGFDELFFMYMEDTDLSLRARLAGFRCVYIPTSIVHHDYKLTIGPQKTYYEERNRYIMLLKCMRVSTLLGLVPVLFLAEVVTWGFSILHDRKNLKNKINAYKWVIYHWREILKERQRVQTYRRVDDRYLLKSMHYRIGYEQTTIGPLSGITHLLFDPFFFVFRKFALIF